LKVIPHQIARRLLKSQINQLLLGKAAHASKAGLTHCNAPLSIHVEQVNHHSWPDPGAYGNVAILLIQVKLRNQSHAWHAMYCMQGLK
jgi:hypothetical protein